MPTLIVTRTGEDAAGLIARLHDLGFGTLLAPVMEIVNLAGPALDLTGIQALLVTSANGVRAFAERNRQRQLKVFAVGDATARAARDAGFSDVSSADGDVDDLARLVAGSLSPSDGALLHVAQSERAGDLAGALTKVGFRVDREILYEARPMERFPDKVRDAISSDGADGVLLYSPRSARLFETLLASEGLAHASAGLDALCLSANVAAALQGPWRRKLAAEAPRQESLLHLLATCYD